MTEKERIEMMIEGILLDLKATALALNGAHPDDLPEDFDFEKFEGNREAQKIFVGKVAAAQFILDPHRDYIDKHFPRFTDAIDKIEGLMFAVDRQMKTQGI